jgi:hypothetical protein
MDEEHGGRDGRRKLASPDDVALDRDIASSSPWLF